MVRQQIKKACEGDTNAFREIADRCDGKAAVVLSGDSDEPIMVSVERGNEARLYIEQELARMGARSALVELEGEVERSDT
jgi:hypothetical protein